MTIGSNVSAHVTLMRSSRALLYKSDWLWLLAYPLYQTVGTLRHEASHALVAWLEGATIVSFVFWPTRTPSGRFLWGYVRWTGSVGWLATAAPYLFDLLTFGLFFWLCTRVHVRHRGLWLNLFIVGLISPLANSAKAWLGDGDVPFLMLRLNQSAVHAYFVLTLALYAVGSYVALKQRSSLTEGDFFLGRAWRQTS